MARGNDAMPLKKVSCAFKNIQPHGSSIVEILQLQRAIFLIHIVPQVGYDPCYI